MIGRLKLVDVPKPDAMASEGDATFRNDGPPATPATSSEVIQGAIEESNVNAVREMVTLVCVLRAYEANSQIVRKVDGANGELIKAA
jgi:flagellar basal body rod protein FlgG